MSTILRILFQDYLHGSQICCYKYILDTRRSITERFIWSIITIIGLIFIIWMIYVSLKRLQSSPTVTTEKEDRVAVSSVPFPAVVFCTENRISRKALFEFAGLVLNATINSTKNIGTSVEEVANNLLFLGNMYDLDMGHGRFYDYDRVHSALTTMYNGLYPVPDILDFLAPKCSDIIKSCQWLGQSINCSKIFVTRRTYTGNCCAFNYQRPLRRQKTDETINQTVQTKKPVQVFNHGSDFGLIVLIDQQFNDYTYSQHSNLGVRVMVFNSQEFPDRTGGSVKEKFLGINEEMFLSVLPEPIDGSESLRRYSIEARKCAFPEEIPLPFSNYYSLYECLLMCRLENLISFCGCISPQYSYIVENKTCRLDDMPCLSRWKLSWYNFEPLVSNVADQMNGIFLDVHCKKCVPTCDMIKYFISSSTSKFDPKTFLTRRPDIQFIDGIEDATNLSIIYINYGTSRVISFDQVPQMQWYEILSNFGSLTGIVFGASIISVIEFIYFVTGKFGANLINQMLTYGRSLWSKSKSLSSQPLTTTTKIVNAQQTNDKFENKISKPIYLNEFLN